MGAFERLELCKIYLKGFYQTSGVLSHIKKLTYTKQSEKLGFPAIKNRNQLTGKKEKSLSFQYGSNVHVESMHFLYLLNNHHIVGFFVKLGMFIFNLHFFPILLI